MGVVRSGAAACGMEVLARFGSAGALCERSAVEIAVCFRGAGRPHIERASGASHSVISVALCVVRRVLCALGSSSNGAGVVAQSGGGPGAIAL